jgi:Helitron helicase-like domain at N-terminus
VPLPLTDLRAQYAALPPLHPNRIRYVPPAPHLLPPPAPLHPHPLQTHPPPDVVHQAARDAGVQRDLRWMQGLNRDEEERRRRQEEREDSIPPRPDSPDLEYLTPPPAANVPPPDSPQLEYLTPPPAANVPPPDSPQLEYLTPPPANVPPPNLPPPILNPPVPPPLPLARQPFNPNWPVHYMGKMEVVCSDCGALHWASEMLVNSPKFGMCCFSGKIKIPRLDNPPQELLHLLSGQDDIGKKFRERIRNYNNALAMTSLGCDQNREINRDGQGPYVFKVQGRLYHRIGSLLPQPESSPLYAQLYIYDEQEALDFRMGNAANSSLNRATMQTLQDMLYRHHPGVQMYKQAFEMTRNMGPDQQCKIALRFNPHTDPRRYNLPTDTSREIAVILPGDGDQPTAGRDIILNRRDGPLREISDLHPLYPSLHYVLLFPTGQLGWHRHIPLNIPDQQAAKREYASQAEYFKYRLFPRTNESNHIFMAGKLFQEFVVDSWATTEQSRLNWYRANQSTIRAETYQGLTDAVAENPATGGHDLGQRLILPSSFSGSSRNMIQHCQDALAINRHFHGADFFLTMTADPNWPEIKEALLPGQSAADRPDLVVRIS